MAPVPAHAAGANNAHPRRPTPPPRARRLCSARGAKEHSWGTPRPLFPFVAHPLNRWARCGDSRILPEVNPAIYSGRIHAGAAASP